MGKRSDFKRVERDYYPTPYEAVVPLIPHLPKRDGKSGTLGYVEPCAGDGSLIEHLHTATMMSDNQLAVCTNRMDIEPRAEGIRQKDVFDLNENDLDGAEYLITNPPWDRKILHPLIVHLCALRPTWLLFDADWVHTKQSAPYIPFLQKIVSVGRVKWIPDSKMTGKDNCAWHCFDIKNTGTTRFYGRV